MPSTGPSSQRGKAVLQSQRVKHSLLSEIMAIDGFEDPQEWEALRDGITDNLEPEGHLKHLLAERIAIALGSCAGSSPIRPCSRPGASAARKGTCR